MRVIRFPAILTGVFLALCGGLAGPAALAEEDRRDKVKAVFLYKFFDYVTWQPERDPVKHPPAHICVLGDAPFHDALHYISQKKQAALPNKERHIKSMEKTEACHILFVADSSAFSHNLLAPHILTVSDEKNFAASGGMIELRDKSDRVELIVNLDAAKQAQLKISSGLLNIAKVIR